MRTVLVTGGAGYIGSHIVEQLVMRGDHVIILDALVYGQPWPMSMQAQPIQVQSVQTQPVQAQSGNLPSIQEFSFQEELPKALSTVAPTKSLSAHESSVITGTLHCVQGQVGDAALLDTLFSHYTIDAVVHCAALIEVGASVKEPLTFYNTNVSQTLTLLDRMKAHNVDTIIFSSSAAVYGNPGVDRITEDTPQRPLNPYGQSKLFIEQVLADCASAYGLRYAALRYFNVAGAYPEKKLGERHEPETHVVPLLIRAALQGSVFNLYSADYGTIDGTCIRDYVHVRDIARANVLALDALCPRAQSSEVLHLRTACSGGKCLSSECVEEESSDVCCSSLRAESSDVNALITNAHTLSAGSFALTIGSGVGVSVLDLVHEVERVTHTTIATRVVERRAGDAARLVAGATQAQRLLGWQPLYSLEKMLHDAHTFYLQGNCMAVPAAQQASKTSQR